MSPSWSSRGRDTGDQEPWQGPRSFSYSIRRFLYRYRYVGSGLLLVAFLLAVVWLVRTVLATSPLAPVFIVHSAPYRWPLPPNAWAAEDIRDLRELDGETITIESGSGPVRFAADISKIVERDSPIIQKIVSGGRRPIVVYVSMHGVFEQGVPYLVPPRGEALNPETWVKLDRLISDFRSKYTDTNLLFVLDCSRIRMNWHMGRPHNDFAKGLKTWWEGRERTNFEGVAILCSANAGQRGWTSTSLRGSVFGHYFRLGLAGAADRDQHGNDNGTVNLRELDSYLKERVKTWVWRHRADTQEPFLLVDGAADDYEIAVTLEKDELNRLISEDLADATSAGQHDSLWLDFEKLRSFQPYGSEPLAWRDLEHQLLWLHQLANSGSAYATSEQRNASTLRARMDEILARKSTADLTRSILDGNSIISGREMGIPSDLDVRSLPLAEYLGSIDPELLNSFSSTLVQFDESATDKMLHRTLLQLDRLGARDLTQQHFLRMLDRYQFPGLWQQSARLRQLLELRQQSEQLAVPDVDTGDARTHYWIRQLLAAADDGRRQAEDALFIEGQPAIEQHLANTASAYQTARLEAQELSKAIRLSDRSWAEIPYFAQWLIDPLRDDRTQATRESDAELIRDVLIPLVNNAKALDDLIDDHSAFGDGLASVNAAISRIKSQAQSVETGLNQLRDRLDSECKRLVDPGSVTTNDALDVRQIEAALRCPLVSPDLRSALVARTSFLEAELSKDTSVESTSSSEPTDPDGQWAQRPGHELLLSLLDLDSADDSVASQWRAGVTQLGDELRALSQRYEDMSSEDELADREVRSEWVAMERRLRRVAAVWFPSRGIENPAIELRRIDLRALVLWHGERSLGDFWGPAGQTMEVRPFFDIATNGYLESSRRMLTSYGSRDISNLRERLAASNRAALNWMSTSATESIRLDDRDDVKTRIAVQPDTQASQLPSGAGAVLMRRNGRRVPDATFGPGASVPIPAGGEVDMILRGQGDSNPLELRDLSNSQLEAVFRGHEFRTPLRVDVLGGVTVAHRPYEYDRSRVTVHSPWTKLSVVYILDCSRSMETPVPLSRSRLLLAREILEQTQFDAGSGDELTQEVLDETLHDLNKTRLDVARGALQEMLANLEARRNVRVGLRFFGHRLGWTTDRPVRLLTSPTYPRNIPSRLTPDDDVERILPLRDFNSAIARRAYRELDGAAPWGQSPLHLALQRTLGEDFVREDIDADQHVIVLTDGRDYQFRPTASSRTTIDEIVTLAQERRVPIHILGLDMNPDELRDAQADFSSIADRTNGIFENLTSATDLIQALRDIFAPEIYQLADRDGQLIDEGPLGTPLYASPEGVRPFFIRFREGEEAILLEGGEALAFFGRPQGSRLDFPRFDRDLVSATDLVSANRSGSPNHAVQFHKPVRTEHGVHFPVSIQRREGSWQWTRRPATAWLEITPVDSTGPTYIFYDANYEPDQPVPVLDLFARDWPTDVSKASIRVWFTSRSQRPQAVASLAPIVNAAGDAEPIELVNVDPGVTLRLDARWVDGDRYRVRIVEVHGEGSDGVGSLKITPPLGDDVRPTEIVRQFDKQRGHVVHSFYYANPDNYQLNKLARAEVGVIRRAMAHGDAWQLPREAVVVDISESGNFLPLATR